MQEQYLDFRDFENPIKWRTKFLSAINIDYYTLWHEIPSESRLFKLAVNSAVLADSPWQNPLNDGTAIETHQYLSLYENLSVPNGGEKSILLYTFELADTQIIRSRKVYDMITLIAEVSGFADILLVGITSLLGLFFTPRLFDRALAQHMGPVEIPKQKKRTANGIKSLLM